MQWLSGPKTLGYCQPETLHIVFLLCSELQLFQGKVLNVCLDASFPHRAVASLNTPFIPADPSVPAIERIKANPVFDYQLYFQEPVSVGPWGQRCDCYFSSSSSCLFLPVDWFPSTLICCSFGSEFCNKQAQVKLATELSVGSFSMMAGFCVFGW